MSTLHRQRKLHPWKHDISSSNSITSRHGQVDLIWSHLILSDLILSYLISYYLILSDLIRSYLILSYLIWSDLIWSYLIWSLSRSDLIFVEIFAHLSFNHVDETYTYIYIFMYICLSWFVEDEFFSKPHVLMIGQYSTGKTSFIEVLYPNPNSNPPLSLPTSSPPCPAWSTHQLMDLRTSFVVVVVVVVIQYILGRSFPGQRIGPEPTTGKTLAADTCLERSLLQMACQLKIL